MSLLQPVANDDPIASCLHGTFHRRACTRYRTISCLWHFRTLMVQHTRYIHSLCILCNTFGSSSKRQPIDSSSCNQLLLSSTTATSMNTNDRIYHHHNCHHYSMRNRCFSTIVGYTHAHHIHLQDFVSHCSARLLHHSLDSFSCSQLSLNARSRTSSKSSPRPSSPSPCLA